MSRDDLVKLIYVFDPLCGWCFGLIPTLRSFVERNPGLPVEVVPGDMFVGARARPYARLSGFIERAEVKLKRVTRRQTSSAFRDMISKPDAPLADSAPPSLAVLQMKRRAPDRVLAFSHAVQEAHFIDAMDLNDPLTYAAICSENGYPELDLNALEDVNPLTPELQASFEQASDLGVSSFPTLVVARADGRPLELIRGIYDPVELQKRFDAAARHDPDTTNPTHLHGV